jgi:hypothetical protein
MIIIIIRGAGYCGAIGGYGSERRECGQLDGSVVAVGRERQRRHGRRRRGPRSLVADRRQRGLVVECGCRLVGGQVEHLQDGRSAERVEGLRPGEDRGSQRGSRRVLGGRNAGRLSQNGLGNAGGFETDTKTSERAWAIINERLVDFQGAWCGKERQEVQMQVQADQESVVRGSRAAERQR